MNTPNSPELEPQDVIALLPWHVNGTLSAEERVSVEQLLHESADLQQQRRMWQAVQTQVKEQALSDVGVDFGWRRLKSQLKSQTTSHSAPKTEWLKMAVAASVLAVVGLQTAILVRTDSQNSMRPLSGTTQVPIDAFIVQVRFADDASINAMNTLLARFDARIVNGPSALGIYELAIPRSAAYANQSALLTALRNEPLLLQVSTAP